MPTDIEIAQQASPRPILELAQERLGLPAAVLEPPEPPEPWISTSSGSTIEKLVPRPTSEMTSIVPPCSSTMRLVVARPRPVPPRFVEK